MRPSSLTQTQQALLGAVMGLWAEHAGAIEDNLEIMADLLATGTHPQFVDDQGRSPAWHLLFDEGQPRKDLITVFRGLDLLVRHGANPLLGDEPLMRKQLNLDQWKEAMVWAAKWESEGFALRDSLQGNILFTQVGPNILPVGALELMGRFALNRPHSPPPFDPVILRKWVGEHRPSDGSTLLHMVWAGVVDLEPPLDTQYENLEQKKKREALRRWKSQIAWDITCDLLMFGGNLEAADHTGTLVADLIVRVADSGRLDPPGEDNEKRCLEAARAVLQQRQLEKDTPKAVGEGRGSERL